MLISTALLLDSNIRISVPMMYSGEIAVPPGGGGLVLFIYFLGY
jgi:hypothetical protein